MEITALQGLQKVYVADISVVDWDDVYPVPLKYSAINLGTKMFGYVRGEDYIDILNPKQEEEFQEEFARLERQESNCSLASELYLDSKENFFLDFVLRNYSLLRLQELFPEELAQALRRTPESVGEAKIEWQEFVRVFFTGQGRQLPDLAVYLKMQHELGIIGHSDYRLFIKGKVQVSLVRVVRKISRIYPQLNVLEGIAEV